MSILRQSQLRQSWARDKLDGLKFAIQCVGQNAVDAIPADADPNGRETFTLFQESLRDNAIRDISEFIFHARASLDYIVYALALHDTLVEHKRTYFPICKCPQEFEASKWKIEPLTIEHQAFVEACQPYYGFESLLLLNSFSNVDKHREFIHIGFLGFRTPVQETRTGSGSVREMKVKFQHTFDVLLRDGTPVTETLEIVHSQIVQILQTFDALLE
jgi:hypothetical protein